MRASMVRMTFLFACLFVSSVFYARGGQLQRYVLFSVRGDVLDPIAYVAGGRFSPVPGNCGETDSATAQFNSFAAAYLKPGRAYNLLYRGAKAGTVVVKPLKDAGSDVLVEVRARVPVGEDYEAIATDAPLGRATRSWRDPQPAEEKAVIEQAKRILVRRKVPGASFGRLRLLRLITSDLDNDGRIEYLASLYVEREDELGVEHTLFFIQEAGQAEPEFVHYAYAESEVEGTTVVPLDHLDVDGDRVDEVITRLTFYENYRYQIYRRKQNGTGWRKVFESETLGCL